MKIRWSGCLISVLGLLLISLACIYGAVIYKVGLFLIFLDVVLKFLGVATEADENKVFAQLFYILLALVAGVLLFVIGLVRALTRKKSPRLGLAEEEQAAAGQLPEHRNSETPAE